MKHVKLIVFLVLALSLAACGSATATPEATQIPTVVADDTIIAEGRLEPIHYTELALNASGLVSEVLFIEGDEIAAGDVIARLDANEGQTLESAQAKAAQELTVAYQEVRDAQFKLDNFDVPSDFNGMTPSEAVEAMLVKLDKARADFEPYKNLSDRSLEQTAAEKNSGVVRGTAKNFKKALDDAWADYRKAILWLELESTLQNANSRLILAQRDFDALQDPSFSADTAGARAVLANAEVRAPFPGVITNLDLKVGEFAASGQPVITVADNSQWIVKTTDLTEIDVVKIKEGQPATVTLDALPGVELNGNVFSISQNFSENQGDVVYEVTILLTDQDPAMRWGMTAVVSFVK
ncbi:MAG: HlyD family efflux transporter periplasmic adaptor subunit [Anaerolineales bacterium]|nr:HlyD family efflux transporter periplasmic adaptor subunit [Anaerolineales bacterium]